MIKCEKLKKIIKIILSVVFFISILLIHLAMGSEDSLQFIKWYVALLIMGLSVLPINNLIFEKFHDKGYVFSKVFGILSTGFLMWLLSSFKIMKFNIVNSYICIAIVFAISYMFNFFRKKKIGHKLSIKQHSEYIISIIKIELFFFFILSVVCYIKGFNSMAYGTEKYMDYGYMAIINKTDYMPPIDMWFAGKYINYYYFGLYISTFITKISNIGVNYGYNFMLMTLCTFTILECYTIVYNMLLTYLKKHPHRKKNMNRIIPIIGGVVGSLGTALAGNMHYVIFGLIFPLLHIPMESSYWFPNTTRYIENTIHEFPSYSFVLGDLHAHVLDIIFVLAIIALLFVHLLNNQELIEGHLNNNSQYKEFRTKNILLNPILLLCGILLGIYKMTNFWDFPIYLVVSLCVFIICNFITYKSIKTIIATSFIQILVLLVVSKLISLPFDLNFEMISSVIKFVTSRSPLYQLIILWALPITTIFYFIYLSIRNCRFKQKGIVRIMEYIYNLDISSLFIIILGICAIGLVIMPEIIYVVDIYTGDSYRANTMFKLTYQAYIMFSLGFGYIITIIIFKEQKYKHLLKYKLALLFVLTILYSYNAVNGWFGNVLKYNNRGSMDATTFLQDTYVKNGVTSVDDNKLINWLNNNAQNSDVILELYGNSYTYDNRISVFTGLATPLGWINHEWLWRSVNSSTKFPQTVAERRDDVDTIYTSDDVDIVKKLIKKYKIKYIIVGYTERNYYENEAGKKINEELLTKLGNIVYETNINNLDNPTYIIKINGV